MSSRIAERQTLNPRAARWLLGLVLPAALFSIGFIPYYQHRNELPARVASHFDLFGAPDGSMPLAPFVGALFGVMCMGALVSLWTALTKRPRHGWILPAVVFAGALTEGFAAVILAWTAHTQAGLTHWEDAAGPGVSALGLVAVAVLAGALAAYLATQRPVLLDSLASGPPARPMDLGAGERAVWQASLHSRWLLGSGFLAAALSAPLLLLVPWFYGAPLLFGGLVMLALSGLTVRADRHGLQIRYGILPWPKSRIPIERILAASAIHVRPMEWGGWGYRGSLTLLKKAAVVLRAGPGLRIDLRGGGVFVVTVDDPETAAALLNAEVDPGRSGVLP